MIWFAELEIDSGGFSLLQSNVGIHAIRCYTAYALEIIEEMGFKAEMDYTTLSGSEPSRAPFDF